MTEYTLNEKLKIVNMGDIFLDMAADSPGPVLSGTHSSTHIQYRVWNVLKGSQIQKTLPTSLAEKVYFRSQILECPSIGQYWNIFGIPVLPENVILTFLRTCLCYSEAYNTGTQKGSSIVQYSCTSIWDLKYTFSSLAFIIKKRCVGMHTQLQNNINHTANLRTYWE